MTWSYRFLAFFLLVAPWSLPAQRGGRPDGLYNYQRSTNPQLLLEVNVQGQRSYFRPSQLRKMPRTVVILSDPATSLSHTYEGVALDRLTQKGGNWGSETVKISFNSRQSVVISARELDAVTKPMIADTVDGKPLTSHAPYYFLGKSLRTTLGPIADVWCITVKTRE